MKPTKRRYRKRKVTPDKPLTEREQRFVDATIHGAIGRTALEKAGYDLKTDDAYRSTAARLRNKRNVAAEIERRMAIASRKADVTIVDVLIGLKELAFANMDDYLEEDARGLPQFKRLSEMTREQKAALSEVSVIEESAPLGQTPKKTIRFKLHNKRDALVDLGRYLKMFVEAQGVNAAIITNNNTLVVVQSALSAADGVIEGLLTRYAVEGNPPALQNGSVLPADGRPAPA
jgi:phage terminase small subunit